MQPRLPSAWSALDIRVRFRGHPVRLRRERDQVTVWSDGAVKVRVGDTEIVPKEAGTRLSHETSRWEVDP
jgi:cellobiose phosphorylase